VTLDPKLLLISDLEDEFLEKEKDESFKI